MVKKPPTDAGGTSSIPGSGRSQVAEQRSPCATTSEPVLWSPGAATTGAHMLRACLCDKRSQHNEKPVHRN